MSNIQALPDGWRNVPLGEVAEIRAGGTPDRGRKEFFGGGIPWIKSGELRDRVVDSWEETISDEGLKNSAATIFPKGTVCIALYGATVGKLGILDVDAATNQAVCGIKLPKEINRLFIYYYLTSIRGWLIKQGKGGAQSNISGQIVKATRVPLPSSKEQSRIVEKIEELFSDLDAGVAALKRAQANLKRYRAAVLKAAVEGRLTAQWRAQRKTKGIATEPAAKLLERILAERSKKWEAAQTKKYADAGKASPKGWQGKYPEPVEVGDSNLPDLPKEWCWAALDAVTEIASGVAKGSKQKPGIKLREVPYLRVANVQRGYLNLTEMKTILATEKDIEDLRLLPGDIFFNEGGDLDKLGRGWVWNGEVDECIHQNHVFRARPMVKEVQPKFISYHGNSFGQQWFLRTGKRSVNLASINMTVLRRFPVPVAPAAEQAEIVSQVEAKLSNIAQAETEIKRSLERAARLRQAILKRAFEGRLV